MKLGINPCRAFSRLIASSGRLLIILIALLFATSFCSAQQTITGTSGNDTLQFVGTTQTLSTTLTNAYTGDTAVLNGQYNVNNAIYNGFGGTNTLNCGNTADFLSIRNSAGNQTIFSMQNISAGGGNDVINLSDSTIVLGDTTINGGAGDDILWGNAGNDTLNGGTGDDFLVGGNGNNTLSGGAGMDVMRAGNGTNNFIYNADFIHPTGAVVRNAGSPGVAGTGQTISIAGMNGSYDNFIGGTGSNTITMSAGNNVLQLYDAVNGFNATAGSPTRLSSIQQISGGSGNDIINLTSADISYGNVTIHGNDGDDVIWSSSGNDTLYGDAGNDSLFSGIGNDTVYGGTGDDTYTYLQQTGSTTFYDGGSGYDSLVIQLNGSYDPLLAGELNAAQAFIAANSDTNSTNGASFTFDSLGLTFTNVESLSVSTVPEPSTAGLFVVGVSFAALRRRSASPR